MKILVVGGGGREHALVWRLKQSPSEPEVICAPGNAGIAREVPCFDVAATDLESLAELARKQKVDLTVVGPEAPLCAGIVDLFQARGLKIFGPSKAAALLEGDKAFAKEIMSRHSIPTAGHRTFSELNAALIWARETVDYPLVVKAAGLAAGKGVVICRNPEEAEEAIRSMMEDQAFGSAGQRIVIEDFLVGEEASIIALTDGKTILVMESSQDHKRAFDGDEGPNTGGMGAYSPAPVVTEKLQSQIEREVLVPIVHALKHEGRPFSGVLYAGLMMTQKGPRVLEFNVRFGDPECEALMMRLRGDLAQALALCAEGRLDEADLSWSEEPAVTVVVAQEGYPGAVGSGRPIWGLDEVEESDDLRIFHAATRRQGSDWIASGGRVLAVTALGTDLAGARDKAYAAIDRLRFPGSFCRRDIGHRALGR
ncbi:MAG: phosphoribosylamine--glycine ligase [Planctomycetes bacterium]|nr:phosphoribosylamine--glycine ligase [Planctomycetota bacterium]